MDDIIATGSTAAAASPRFATQDEVVDLSGDMEAELGYVYGDDAHEAQEPEDEDEDEDMVEFSSGDAESTNGGMSVGQVINVSSHTGDA